jgi:hypothetical protein
MRRSWMIDYYGYWETVAGEDESLCADEETISFP